MKPRGYVDVWVFEFENGVLLTKEEPSRRREERQRHVKEFWKQREQQKKANRG